MSKNSKRALIIRGGAMKGAFTAGVMCTLHEKLGVNYFDAIYSNSVGVFGQAFFASNQPDLLEGIWREYVHDKKLINFSNILESKPILNLDYLVNLFRSKDTLLNVEQIKKAKPELFCILSNYETKQPEIFNLKEEDLFQIMLATSAVPILYNKKIFINGIRYHDGSLTVKKIMDKLIIKLLDSGYGEVIVKINRKGAFKSKNSKIFIIEPSKMPLYHHLDTNQKRILETIEQGKSDALQFLKDKLNN
ncbi:MAG: patatin-like phospholipase family protein [Patescibacteria group bacterium]